MTNAAMIIRCQKIGPKELHLLYFFRDFFSSNVFFAINSSEVMEYDGLNIVNWSFNDIAEDGWPKIDLGWRCGDINFYEVVKKFGDFKYYWMCEPDVFFHKLSTTQFFSEFEGNSSDFLAVSIGKRDKYWQWHKHSSIINKNV